MDFWNSDVWLPPDVTWRHFENDTRFAHFRDLLYPLPGALLLICFRSIFEQKIFRPFGVYLGISTNKEKEETDCSVRSWWGRKLRKQKPSTLDKFCETGWRWSFYLFIHMLGVSIMWSKPWLWQTSLVWLGYPDHYIDGDIWWYYMLELSFYWSLFFSQFADVRRKDFLEMSLHHMAAITLLALSWTCHLHRMGSLVLLLHDFSDHWLELGKMVKYAKCQRICDFCFAVFSITWILTRVGVYPSWIMYSTAVDMAEVLGLFPMYYVFNLLLSGLMILHLFWTYFILKSAIKVLFLSEEISDERSECGDTEDEDDDGHAVVDNDKMD